MKRIRQSQSGYTLIEAVVGVMIIALAASAIMLGVSKARSSLNSIRLRESAYEELKVYTDYWKSMAAAGKISPTNSSNANGERVVLKQDIDGNTVVEGRLFRTIVRGNDSGEFSVYYKLKTWVEWDDNVYGHREKKRLEFFTKQLKFNL